MSKLLTVDYLRLIGSEEVLLGLYFQKREPFFFQI